VLIIKQVQRSRWDRADVFDSDTKYSQEMPFVGYHRYDDDGLLFLHLSYELGSWPEYCEPAGYII
jgi:hypothetical protein